MTGTLSCCLQEELGHTQSTKISIEFGTVPPMQVLQAMRAEQWLQLHPEAAPAQAAAIRRAMRDAFYVDADGWKAQVLDQALQALGQAVGGLRQG